MSATASITRRVTLTVLLLEIFAAVALIAMVTNHERVVRFEALDANVRAMSNALLGSVQEADGESGSVKLDPHGINVPSHAIYRVTVDQGQVLGSVGDAPALDAASRTIAHVRIAGRPYRFYVLKGERVIDPDSPRAIDHHVTVVYGVPEGRTWHAIVEATRFFAIATVILLGITSALMFWLIRRFLSPIRQLAVEAGQIDAERWVFDPPASSRQFEELAPLASAIEKTVARLHRSFEQQQRFTSDAAHELKTDLAIIKSSVQLLTMKRRSVEDYEGGLQLTMGDIARLERTVQKMLTLARLEQAPEVPGATCNIVQALDEAVAQSQPVASMREISVICNNLPGAVEVSLSPDEATLLCANVLMNALHYSPASAAVEITMQVQADTVVLLFRDHGEGISERDRPFLFDPFYRGDTSRSRASGGTGLGLSICKAICDRAKGSIRIANHPGGGAEVGITLPLHVLMPSAGSRSPA